MLVVLVCIVVPWEAVLREKGAVAEVDAVDVGATEVCAAKAGAIGAGVF